MKKFIVLVAFCGCLVLFSFAGSALGAVFTVSNGNDSGPGSLRQAVLNANAAASADTIEFTSAMFGTTITISSEIFLGGSNGSTLLINGPGANRLTIDGGPGSNRIFQSNFAPFTLRGVTLQNGGGAGFSDVGSAIRGNFGQITIDGVVFQNNTGTGGAGAIFFQLGANHVINNSTFTNNSAGTCGALRIDQSSVTITNTTVSGNTSREGTIWVTGDGGLNRLQKQFIKPLSISDGLIYSEVYPLLETRDGDVYVGTPRGLSRYRGGIFSTVLEKNENGENISVTALFEDERSRLWIGSGGELYRLENEKVEKLPTRDNSTIFAIKTDRAGNLWIGGQSGLLKYRDDRLIASYTTADGLPAAEIRFIHEDGSGVLWFATYSGLTRIENDKFVTLTTRDGLASDRVRTIYEEADGTLWIGTYDGGLSRFKDGRFFNYTIANGLFNNGVFQILEDKRGNFWISCNKGIYRVSKQELNDLAEGKIPKINPVGYGKQDGMLNTECNGGRQPAGARTRDGKLWFPTQDGVAVIDPEEVTFNKNAPPVQIEDVLRDRRPVDFRNGVTLSANDDNLEVRYTGISFIKPEQTKFRYRIVGLDENWNDLGAIREVYFPSLPAGDYTFQVVAANSDGVWNEAGATLKLTVLAPFWQQTWFVLLSAAITIMITLWIFRLREKELRRRQAVQQEFSRRLIESQEHERKRIASELHDSLGQYLLAIKNWALFGLNALSGKDPAREYLTEVSDTSSLALDEVRQIAHNLRPYQLERLGLTNTLEYMLKTIQGSSSINFTSEFENVDGVLSKDAEIVFYRVVQETINNVIKHSEAQNARLSIKLAADGLEFVCGDDGKGFDVAAAKASPQSGLGLHGIAERLNILGGQFKIESEPGKGTTVFVRVYNTK